MKSLAEVLEQKQIEQGFVGCDLRLAALSILHVRGLAPNFRLTKHTPENIAYWASMRHFCHAQCSTEEDVLKLAEQSCKS